MPDGAKPLPIPGVAPECPVVDGFRDGQSIDQVSLRERLEERSLVHCVYVDLAGDPPPHDGPGKTDAQHEPEYNQANPT
jgi:hypothetical protein